jgi:hypothetical protein
MPSHETVSTDGKVTVTSVNSIKSGKVHVPDGASVIVIRGDSAGEYGKYRNTRLIAEPLSVLLETISSLPNATEVLRVALETALQQTGAVSPNLRAVDLIQSRGRRAEERLLSGLQDYSKVRHDFIKKYVSSTGRIGQLTPASTSSPSIEVKPSVNHSPDKFREAVLDSADWLTSAKVSERAGYTGTNASAAPNKWKKACKAFSIQVGGKDLYPSYIFDVDGKPYPVVKTILANLGPNKSPWAIAAWFASKNGWLGGEAPMDMLTKDQSLVIKAAAMEGNPSEHG